MTPHMGLAWGKQKSLLADGSHQAALSCDEKYEELVGPRGDSDIRQRLHPDRLQMVRDENGQDRENGGVSRGCDGCRARDWGRTAG